MGAAHPKYATCEIRDWDVFRPGRHLPDREATEAEVRQVADNFAAFAALSPAGRPYLTPTVSLGHDRGRRFTASLGFPSLGTVNRCAMRPDGHVRISVGGVPPDIGGWVNAGYIRGGSVDISPPKGSGIRLPDPRHPGRYVPGQVLTNVALLGDELPAVYDLPPPRAVWPDGTPVAPRYDVGPLLSAMARVSYSAAGPGHDLLFGVRCPTQSMSAAFGGMPVDPTATRDPGAMPPADPAALLDQIRQINPALADALAAEADPVKLAGILAALQAPPAAPAGPAAPPPADAFSAFRRESFEREARKVVVASKGLIPAARDGTFKQLMAVAAADNYAAWANFDKACGEVMTLPESPMLRDVVETPEKPKPAADKKPANPVLTKLLAPGGVMAAENPALAAKLRAAAPTV